MKIKSKSTSVLASEAQAALDALALKIGAYVGDMPYNVTFTYGQQWSIVVENDTTAWDVEDETLYEAVLQMMFKLAGEGSPPPF